MIGSKKNWKKWLVVLGCFCINFTLFGIARSNGVLYVALLAHFSSTRKQAAWPHGLYAIVISVVGPLAGLLTNYFAIRTIVFIGAAVSSLSIAVCYFAFSLAYITVFYGAFFAFGVGLIVTLTHVIVNQHFKTKRATAAGFVYAGSAIGSFLFPPLTEYLLEQYSLRGTFLLLGGMALHSLLGALLYLPTKEKHLSNDGEDSEEHQELKPPGDTPIEKRLGGCEEMQPQQLHDKRTFLRKVASTLRSLRIFIEVLSDPMFSIISISFASTLFVAATYLMVVVDFAMDRRIEESKAVFLISTYSVGDLVGRLCTGWIADLKCVRRMYIVIITMVSLGTLTFSLPFTHTYWLLMAFSTAMGIMAGCNMINFSATMIEYVGDKKLPVAMGFGLLSYGLMSCLRPDLVGFFRDRTGTYDYLLYTLGAMLVFGAGLWLFEPLVRNHRKRAKTEQRYNAEKATA